MADGNPQAGWYSDPSQVGQERYWDGTQWTNALRPAAQQLPPPGQGAAGVALQQKTGNGFAVTALVCGIVGAVVGLIPILAVVALALGLVALVFGILGWRRANRDPAAGRRGMAIAGTILGILALGLTIAGFVIVDDAVDDLNRDLNRIENEYP